MSEHEVKALIALIAQRVGLSVQDVTAWLESVNSLADIEERILRGQYANAIVGVEDAAKRLAATYSKATSQQDSRRRSGSTPRLSRWFDSTPRARRSSLVHARIS